MKKFIRICSFLLTASMMLTIAPIATASAETTSLSEKVVVVFGDSLTNFGGKSYADLIETNMGIKIYNRGVGGDTSWQGRVRLDTVLNIRVDENGNDVEGTGETPAKVLTPDVVIMCFCSNDQSMTREANIACIYPEGYIANMKYMIEELQKVGTEVILFTPNPVSEKYTPWGYGLHYDYDGGEQLDAYCNILRDLAVEYDLTLIDMHREYDLVGDFEDYMIADGLHPSDIGYNFYATKFESHLRAVYDNMNKATLTVNCVDEQGNVLKTFDRIGADGANMTVHSPEITGYTPVCEETNVTLSNSTVTIKYENSLAKQIGIAEAVDPDDYSYSVLEAINAAVEEGKELLGTAELSVQQAKSEEIEEYLSRKGNYEYILSTGKAYTATAGNRTEGYNNYPALTNGTKNYSNGGNTTQYYAWNRPEGATENKVEVVVDLGSVQSMNSFSAYMAASETWGINPPADYMTVDIYVSDNNSSFGDAVATIGGETAEMVRKFTTVDGSAVKWTTYRLNTRLDENVSGRYVKFVITNREGNGFIWLDEVEVGRFDSYVEVPEATVISKNADYTTTSPNRNDGFDDDGVRLTDGTKGSADGGTSAYSGWNRTDAVGHNNVEVVLDLGETAEMDVFRLYMAGNEQWQVLYPHDTNAIVKVSVSDSRDGTFTPVTRISKATPTGELDTGANGKWVTFLMETQIEEAVSARYVKFEIMKSDGGPNFIWMDEIEVAKSAAVDYSVEPPVEPPVDPGTGDEDPIDPPAEPEIIGLRGDVTKNGEIDSRDYVFLKRAYFGTYKFDETAKLLADVNNSGGLDSRDYVYLKRAYFGTYKIPEDIKYVYAE